MNDPNGLVYYNGLYHLFFQYNPYGDVWGNMNWGHAVSEDLISWTEKPIAIHANPDGLGYIFSGSAVVDWDNTSNLGLGSTPPLVAVFTHNSKSGVQVQSIAYSQDGGDSWAMYTENPVIEDSSFTEFRDPKVFWYEEKCAWIMVLAVGDRVHFYQSPNLIDWEFTGEFGQDNGSHEGVWECPDLFQLRDDVSGTTRWCLLVSVNSGGPNGGSGTQYFIGDFNGSSFTVDHLETLWLDYGPDNYAGVTWDGLQGVCNRRIKVGWMSNWKYASFIPTYPWRGVMTIPRELSLYQFQGKYLVRNYPVQEVDTSSTEMFRNELVSGELYSFSADTAVDIQLKLSTDLLNQTIQLHLTNNCGESVLVTYDPKIKQLVMDRAQSGWQHSQFRSVLKANTKLPDDLYLNLRFIVDSSSVELFWENGKTSMTALVFPTEPFNTIFCNSSLRQSLGEIAVFQIES